MRIILSPAKKMRIDVEGPEAIGVPCFMEQTEQILNLLKTKQLDELQRLWKCNDEIARENWERIQGMELYKHLTPAVLAYDGIAFKYMAPSIFEYGEYDYVQEHLCILSAFYGVVRAMDGVTPYRLEMQAKLALGGSKDIYSFWGQRLYNEVRDESGIIINLASKEYSKCIEKYLKPEDTYITVEFLEEVKGKLVVKATYAKMARGEMVRYMAENHIEEPEAIKGFTCLGYQFRADLSDATHYIFERVNKSVLDA